MSQINVNPPTQPAGQNDGVALAGIVIFVVMILLVVVFLFFGQSHPSSVVNPTPASKEVTRVVTPPSLPTISASPVAR